MNAIVIQCLLCIHLSMLTYAAANNITMSTILEEIFTSYDKKLPPKFDQDVNDRQVLVTVNMFVVSMFAVSEADMDYSMSMFLRERWLDERLVYNDTLNLTRLELDFSLHHNVWVPDMYILNEKYSDFHEVTVPNRMMHLYPDGQVQLSMRVTGAFSCRMNLQKYPFDKQACHFEVESYGHSTENMRFVWSSNAVSTADNIEFPQFALTKTSSYNCEKSYYGIIYPCIGVKFVLERNYAYYIIQIYLPSILIVVLSWVNFWLDCTSVPARISLGLLCVLTMTTQSAGVRANLPQVSYVKAIDIYMATCLAFVFIGLVEFAYVNVLTRNETKKPDSERKKEIKRNGVEPMSNGVDKTDDANPTDISLQIDSKSWFPWFRGLSGLQRARLVDKISRVLFPSTFLVFNMGYWIFYFTWTPDFEKDLYT